MSNCGSQDPRLQGRAPGFRQDRIGTRYGQDRDKIREEEGKKVGRRGGGVLEVREW